MNVPIDELHVECLEARNLIRRLHGEARGRLGLDCPAADVLEAAADLIEQKGRWRGHPGQGRHCPYTAISRIRPQSDAAANAVDALYKQVGPIIDWNDQEPDDTVVLNTMRHVAQRLREADS